MYIKLIKELVLCLLLQYPCSVILILTVPVIDHTAELHNWNRWLNILHCITGPTLLALLSGREAILQLYLPDCNFPILDIQLFGPVYRELKHIPF